MDAAAAGGPPNIPLFEADFAKAMQADYDARKKAGTRSALTGGGSGPGTPTSKKKAADKAPEPPRADVALQKKALNAMAQNTIDKNIEASTNRKAAMLRLLDRYYSRPQLAQWLPKPRPALTVRHDEREIIAAVNNVRASLNARGSDMAVRYMLTSAAPHGLEYATMTMGFNPLKWDLHGFSEFFADEQVQAALEPEITEFCVEWQEWFASPYYVRFVMKVGQLAQVYSAGQKEKHARSRPVSASVEAATAGL